MLWGPALGLDRGDDQHQHPQEQHSVLHHHEAGPELPLLAALEEGVGVKVELLALLVADEADHAGVGHHLSQHTNPGVSGQGPEGLDGCDDVSE